jgi:hypothetical protein
MSSRRLGSIGCHNPSPIATTSLLPSINRSCQWISPSSRAVTPPLGGSVIDDYAALILYPMIRREVVLQRWDP